MSYPHESIYFKKEEGEEDLLKKLKEEAKNNNVNFSSYVKQLIEAGRNTQIYKLPETVTQLDQSGEIKALREEISKLKSDTVRLTELKSTGFDWNKIFRVLDNSSYKTEFAILEEAGISDKSMFTDDYDQEFLDMQISELQANLCLRAEYYKDVTYKKNQGWKLCNK